MSVGGLSRERLGRVHGMMAGYVERGEVPGLVTLVSRRDDLAAVPGRFGWDGGLGTSWYSDPTGRTWSPS
ncbi:MAG: hypothetical protein ACR2PL_18200 [Dehalococcoidia bacterium]